MLLTACQPASISPSPVVSDSITTAVDTAMTAADTESSTEPVTGDSTILPPVRYTIDYEIIDIFETHPEIKTATPVFYTKNDHLYISRMTYQDQSFQYHLSVLDEDGNPTAYDLPPFDGIIPRYVYPLENGKYVLIYSPTRTDKRDERHLTIADADGRFEKSVYISDRTVEKGIQVFEEPTPYGYTLLYIFIDNYDGYYYCYDMHLNETVIENVYHIKKFLGDDRFLFGMGVGNLSTVNLKTNEIKDYTLHLPDNLGMARFHIDSEKNYYFQDSNGIYLYQGNEQPVKILDTHDSGLRYDNQGSKRIHILNSRAIYEFNAGTGQLLLYRMTRIPDTDTRSVIQIDVMGLTTKDEAWLYDGVTQFNNQNDTYKISLNMIGDIGGVVLQDYYKETIDEMLLYGSHPDMLIISQLSVLESYYEKGIFLDLTDRIDARLLGCVHSVSGDSEHLYQIPMQIQLTTLAAAASEVQQMLTYDTFFSMMEQLEDGQLLASGFENSFFDLYAEFIDYDAKISTFNTEEFRSALRCLYEIKNNRTRYTNAYAGALSYGKQFFSTGQGDSLDTYAQYGAEDQYWTVNGTVGTALENGDLKFLSVEMHDIRAFPALKMLFGDTEFTLCGYPSRSGGSAYIHSDLSASVLWDTEYADGCAEFLNFLLSDSMQGALAANDAGIPVTHSALSATIDRYRYSLYDRDTAYTVYNRNTPGYISLHPMEYSAEWLPAFDQLSEEDQKRRLIEITDEDKQMLLQFFDDLRPRRQTVSTVHSIITEEISYWENNARSLEETTKIIDSRVWIYLNE